MCRKLGKGHPEYIDRNAAKYTVDEHGVMRMRRMYNGMRVDKHYGANVLNAWTDLRDKFWSWFPDQAMEGQVANRPKARQLEHLGRFTHHGITRYGKAKRLHLRRNHCFQGLI